MHRDHRVEAGCGLPGAIAHGSNKLAVGTGGIQWHSAAIAGNQVPAVGHAVDLDLQPFDRRVYIANGPSSAGFFTQYMPWFQRLAQFQLDAALVHRAVPREAKLEVWSKPIRLHRVPRLFEIQEDVFEVLFYEMRQQKPVVQLCAPAHQSCLVRSPPETGN